MLCTLQDDMATYKPNIKRLMETEAGAESVQGMFDVLLILEFYEPIITGDLNGSVVGSNVSDTNKRAARGARRVACGVPGHA